MTARPLRTAAVALAAALAACTSTTAPEPSALLAEPSAVAVFRGVTTVSGLDAASPIHPYRPFLAVANTGANDLAILDGVTDALVPARIPLRGLVYPVAGRPLLLVSADLGDRKPDLLAVVTAGDLPWLGGSRLEIVRTWAADGAIAGEVDLGADILALAALPFDPDAPGTVRIAAALAGEQLAVVTLRRSPAGDGTAIDVAGAEVAKSGPLGFQPVDLAVLPGDRARVFAASPERLPDATLGVAELSVTGTPAFTKGLGALAATRLVAAARLAEARYGEALPDPVPLDSTAFAGRTPVNRIYAVLDEAGCGPRATIACGLVALDPDAAPDPVRGALLVDPTPAGTMQAPFLAPLQVGHALALAAMGGPAAPPSTAAADAEFAGTYLRIWANPALRHATAVAAVAGTDGLVTFVDLSRWDLPSQQLVHTHVGAAVTSTRPSGATGAQWLVLEPSSATTPTHDPAALSTAVRTTAGYTPTDRWTVTREGILPHLSGRRAEVGSAGGKWLALQATTAGGVFDVVRLADPTLGVRPGDVVVIEPTQLGTCATFEATVADVRAPDGARPGGYVTLDYRLPTNPAWDRCLDLATAAGVPPSIPPPASAPTLAATFRAAGYVLVRGTGAAAVHVGRPELGVPFEVAWQSETAPPLDLCTMPPAVAWPGTACSAACRDACQLLQRVRLGRRLSYVPEAPAGETGPALRFTLAKEVPSADVPRDLALVIDTAEGRVPFRVGATRGSPVDPRSIVPFDRSPWAPGGGPRFLVPYAGGIVVDATPTLPSGGVTTVH